jgi:hypothetical protein
MSNKYKQKAAVWPDGLLVKKMSAGGKKFGIIKVMMNIVSLVVRLT